MAELLHYRDSTLRAIGTSQALAAKDKKKLQKSCRAECELNMRRLTQSGGTSSGQSSNVGTSIGAEEHMDQTAVQRNHSEARAALAAQRAAEAAPGAAAGAMPGAQTSALAYGAGLWVGDAGQSKAEEDGDSEAGPSRPQPPPETAASQHRAEWLASLHEGSLLDAYVQDAWWEATHEGAVSLLQGEDEEKLHLLRIDGFPERYVCRDEKIRPRWEHVDSDNGELRWTTADS